MLESEFQREVIEDLENLFPGCLVLKNDANYIQGFPDLTFLYYDFWAILECKRSAHERKQPNQEYYVDRGDTMSFGSFIYPENKEEVYRELQQALRTRRSSRISKR